MPLQTDPTRLEIYLEGRKRRMYVGALTYNRDKEKDKYEFLYDSKYVNSPKAIPIGPDLNLFKTHHISEKGRLFPSFADRIPSKSNPAYEEYCRSQGISPNERNPIILLGTIGRRGPSSFIFEPAKIDKFSHIDILRFRKTTRISRHDMSVALEINELTLQRIETGKSTNPNTMRRIQIYLEFPDVALWQLELSGSKLSNETLERIRNYFENRQKSAK